MSKIQWKKLFLCYGIVMLMMSGLYGCAAKGDTNVEDANIRKNNTAGAGAVRAVEDNKADIGNAGGSTEYIIGDVSASEKLELDHEYRNVTLSISEDENIHIKTNANITDFSQDELNEIRKNIEVKSHIIGNKCTLKVIHKSEGIELWDWLERERKERNVSVDLEIFLPSNFSSFDVSTDTGTIQISDLDGNMDVDTDNGDINLTLNENLSRNAVIDLETGNGNIEINLKNNAVEYSQEETDYIKAKVNGVCSLEAEVDNGSVVVVQ